MRPSSTLFLVWPLFRLALDGWPKRTIFGNQPLNRRTCPSHLNFSLIIAIGSWIEPRFSYSLLFEIRSVKQVPKRIYWHFLWKTANRSSSVFRSAHVLETCLNTVIIIAPNSLILVHSFIFLFFWKNFNCEKYLGPWLFYFLYPPYLLIIVQDCEDKINTVSIHFT